MKKKTIESQGHPRLDDHDEPKLMHPSVNVVGDHIYFYGGIDEKSAMELNRAIHAVSMKLAPTAFSSMQEVGSPAPIWLHINSMGGEVFSSFAIADTIERVSTLTPVITVIEGAAASGATIISTAGSKRLMRKKCFHAYP
jgi:ATP-dependent protease ClpP protease subunit